MKCNTLLKKNYLVSGSMHEKLFLFPSKLFLGIKTHSPHTVTTSLTTESSSAGTVHIFLIHISIFKLF